MNNITKITIVDDHLLFLKGLLEMIKKNIPSSTDISIFNSPKDFLNEKRQKNELLITDIQMPEMNGIELIELLKMQDPSIKIIVVSMHNKYTVIKKCKSLGVEGYLLKDDSDKDLLAALTHVINGKKFYSEKVQEHFKKVQETQNMLSIREEQVLNYLCEGFTSKEIADQMFVGLETIKTHKRNIRSKLGISKTVDLIKYNLEREKV